MKGEQAVYNCIGSGPHTQYSKQYRMCCSCCRCWIDTRRIPTCFEPIKPQIAAAEACRLSKCPPACGTLQGSRAAAVHCLGRLLRTSDELG